MKKQKTTFLILFIALFLFISSIHAMAQERNIYVGDLINIKVSKEKFTEDELREKFKDFEVLNIESDDQGSLITLRSFETGENNIQLGDKEIKIVIKSTLDEVEQDGIFEGDLNPERAGFSLNYNYIFYFLIIIFLGTGGVNVWRFIKRKKMPLISTYQYFINETNNINLNDDDSFVKMTLSLKQYLEESYSCCIRGKTSSEITGEIKCIPDLHLNEPAIELWLKQCDFYKYTGVSVSREEKQELLKELVAMVEKINEVKEVEV